MKEIRSRLDKNGLLFGFLLGMFSPAFVFAVMVVATDAVGSLTENDADLGGIRIRTIFLVAICTNIFWIRYYNEPFYFKTLRGVVFATMTLSLLWFVRYYSDLYST